MPIPLTDYEVTSPDGSIVKFRGPSDLSDEQVAQRAKQEAGFQSGRIPSTFRAGAIQSAGETLADKSKAVGAGVGLAGALFAQPEVVAAAPAIGRATQALGEYISGRKISPTSVPEVAMLAGEGALAGYGPRLAAGAMDSLASKTIPHQLANGRWIEGVKGKGVLPWAVRTMGEYAGAAGDALHSSSKAVASLPSLRELIMQRLQQPPPDVP